jgi:hypothetical protein
MIEVPFIGRPLPKAIFSHEGVTVEHGRGVIVESSPTATLTFLRLERSHAGSFRCSLTNSFGRDSVDFWIRVLDRPEAPRTVKVVPRAPRLATIHWTPPAYVISLLLILAHLLLF